MFQRIIALEGLEGTERTIPFTGRFFGEEAKDGQNRMHERHCRQFGRIRKPVSSLKRGISAFFVRSSKKPTSERRTIPVVTGVEVAEKDVVDAARYLAALQAAYAMRKEQSQAYSTDSMQEAERYCQLNFF